MTNEWIFALVLYVLTGVMAGMISGILGIGGGVVVVPALLFILKYADIVNQDIAMHVAAGSSLAIMIFTSHSTIRAHYKHGTIRWELFQQLWPGISAGVICGVLFADLLPTKILQIFFGLFLLFVAYKMWTSLKIEQGSYQPTTLVNRIVSFVIGFKSGLLGVGGGTLVIPYLNYCGVSMRETAAVSSLCTMTVALIGTLTFVLSGMNETGLPHYSTGYIYWPAVLAVAIPSMLFAPLGTRLTYILPVKQLKYVFIVVILITAASLISSLKQVL